MAQTTNGLKEVSDLLKQTKQQDLAPLLVSHGVQCVEDIATLAPALTRDGKIELLTVSQGT